MKKRQVAPALQVTRVAFRSNVQIGSFQTVHVEAEAAVGPRQDPNDVLDHLEAFVAARLVTAKDGRPADTPPPPTGRFRDRLVRPR